MNEWKVEFSSSECKALKGILQVFPHRFHFVHCILSSSFGRKFGGPEHGCWKFSEGKAECPWVSSASSKLELEYVGDSQPCISSLP